jgi:two-component system, sensor histidine kinase PdtaS
MPFKALRDEPTGPDPVKEARRLRLHQRILRDFGRIALEDLEIGSLLQRAVAQAARATGVRHTKIMRYRTEQGDLLAEAGFGWRRGVVGNSPLTKSPWLDSVRSRTRATGAAWRWDDRRAGNRNCW